MDEVIIGYKKKLLEAGMQVEGWSVDKVVEFLTNIPQAFSLDFIGYARKYVESLEVQGRTGTAKQYRIATNALIRFFGRDTLDISEITVSFLQSFENHLRNEPVYKGRRKGEAVATDKPKAGRAISLYMSHIRTIHEAAKGVFNDEDGGIINIPYLPLKSIKFPP